MLSKNPTNQDIIDQIEAVTDNEIQMRLTTGIAISLSTLIRQALDRDYDTMSALFMSNRGYTLERFIALRRIDKVKELLVYTDSSLDEIAEALNYSTAQNLLSELAQLTGLPVTYYRDIRQNKQAIGQKLRAKHNK